jgi:hypothetical protein
MLAESRRLFCDWVGLELAGSISNAVGMGGAGGKCEKGKVRAGAVYFLREFVAWVCSVSCVDITCEAED